MNKYLLSTAIASLAFISVSAHAEDKPTTPAVTSAIATTTTATPPAVKQEVKSESSADVLKDGTKIEIGSDGIVKIINADGTKTTAPDGVLTLKDETTFNVKDGKKVVN